MNHSDPGRYCAGQGLFRTAPTFGGLSGDFIATNAFYLTGMMGWLTLSDITRWQFKVEK